jgi:TldD protein
MIERPHSAFLAEQKAHLAGIIRLLAPNFDYVSVLGTDDRGVSYAATPGETKTYEPRWTQRGFVFRAQKKGRVAEYACSMLPNPTPADCARRVAAKLDALFLEDKAISYPPIPDEPLVKEFHGSIEEDPLVTDPEIILSKLNELRERLTDGKTVVMAQSRFEFVDVSRIFVSPNRELFQSFAWSQAYLFGVARKGAVSKMSYRPSSGRKGLEILRELEARVPELADELAAILDAEKIEPGEYEVILDPDMSGTLAHEAFGHGVETDCS